MIQPINYYQTDSKWAKKRYAPKGYNMTIGSSGCGPTCAAMVINSIKGNGVTPVETCEWAMERGYIAKVGTYWSYFVPQFKEYKITCKQTSSSNEALNALKKGSWVIAIMGKGNWTSGGHFILAYGYEDNTVYINDPASTLTRRTRAKWDLFKKESNGYWIISVPAEIQQKGIKPEREKSIQEMYVSSTTGLKVRSGAGSFYKEIEKLDFNEEVKILATKKEWVMIDEGKWINSKYLSKYPQIKQKYKALQQMNIRDGYSVKNTQSIGKIKKGTIFEVTKIRNDWGYSEQYKGWICLKGETKIYCEEVK